MNTSANGFDDDDDFDDIDSSTLVMGDINDDDDDDDITIEDDLHIEVVDDTPLEDVGRLADPDAIQIDDSEDEAQQYSRKVRDRIGKLTAQAQAARRNADRIQRERDEAVNAIQTLRNSQQQSAEQIKALRMQLHNGEKVYVDEVIGSLQAQLDNATARYKNAYELGQTDDLVQANKEMAAIVQRMELAKQYTPPPPVADQGVELPTPVPASKQPEMDATTKTWVDRNMWFNDPDKVPMRNVAMAVHAQLVKQGVHPILDAGKYFKTIDREMRQRFPEYSWPDKQRNQRTLTANSNGARKDKAKQVRLSKSQVALAESLGLTPKQYALEVAKLDSRRG
jgi:hypothetical protein